MLPEARRGRPARPSASGCRATAASRRRSATSWSSCRSTTSAAVAPCLAEHRGQVAGMILEPIMMNAGIIPPDAGYLAAIRDLLHADGALLIFDEVKTGFTTGPGGVTARYGVVPDMVCLAKALGGGISVAAIGGTDDGDVGDRRRPLRAGRHLQRQPARDGGGPGHAVRGAHRRRPTHSIDAAGAPGCAASLEATIARTRLRLARGERRRQGLRDVPREPVREFRDFLADRRPAGPPALAHPAQRRRVPAAMGQGGAMVAVRSARRGRCRPLRRATSPGWPRRWQADRLLRDDRR